MKISEMVTIEGVHNIIDNGYKFTSKLKGVVWATIILPNGEKRNALLDVKYKDGIISCELVNENIRQWIKKGIMEIKK